MIYVSSVFRIHSMVRIKLTRITRTSSELLVSDPAGSREVRGEQMWCVHQAQPHSLMLLLLVYPCQHHAWRRRTRQLAYVLIVVCQRIPDGFAGQCLVLKIYENLRKCWRRLLKCVTPVPSCSPYISFILIADRLMCKVIIMQRDVHSTKAIAQFSIWYRACIFTIPGADP